MVRRCVRGATIIALSDAGEKVGRECKTEDAARTRGREKTDGLSNGKQQMLPGTGMHSPAYLRVYIYTSRQASHHREWNP